MPLNQNAVAEHSQRSQTYEQSQRLDAVTTENEQLVSELEARLCAILREIPLAQKPSGLLAGTTEDTLVPLAAALRCTLNEHADD